MILRTRVAKKTSLNFSVICYPQNLLLSFCPSNYRFCWRPCKKVYPIGIPLLYFFILWTNRESLNPTLEARKRAETEAAAELEAAAEAGDVSSRSKSMLSHMGTRLPKSMEEAEKLEERIRQRRQNPDLVPSMFLWKDFGASIPGFAF